VWIDYHLNHNYNKNYNHFYIIFQNWKNFFTLQKKDVIGSTGSFLKRFSAKRGRGWWEIKSKLEWQVVYTQHKSILYLEKHQKIFVIFHTFFKHDWKGLYIMKRIKQNVTSLFFLNYPPSFTSHRHAMEPHIAMKLWGCVIINNICDWDPIWVRSIFLFLG